MAFSRALNNARALATTAARGQVRRMSGTIGDHIKGVKDVKVKDAARYFSDKMKDPAAQQAARVSALPHVLPDAWSEREPAAVQAPRVLLARTGQDASPMGAWRGSADPVGGGGVRGCVQTQRVSAGFSDPRPVCARCAEWVPELPLPDHQERGLVACAAHYPLHVVHWVRQ